MKGLPLLLFALTFMASNSAAAPVWKAGELHYPQDQSEVSAFINTKNTTQLQTVLCAKNTG